MADDVGTGRSQLVNVAVAADDDGRDRSQLAEHVGQVLGQVGGEDAHQLAARACRVGQRAEDIEDGAHVQVAARADGVLHGRVQLRGKQKADADLVHAAPDLLRRQVEVDAQLGQHVGAAAATGAGAVAVLGDAHARARRHEGDRRADVERARPIAAGAAGIEQVAVKARGHPDGVGAHGAGAAQNLGLGLALHAQAHQVGADLRFGGLPAHDLAHDRFGLLGAKLPEAADHVKGALDVNDWVHGGSSWWLVAGGW
ncbi:MAG: hypothetical protein BWY52_03173 [Chloroflexi bacterium ADurb.Bin325]|nr:MAG: hypothetical protein BWY52_03173 [Chloroflexi bacterium ADurb.Bin325]